MGCQNTVMIVWPSVVIPTITTTAISTARSPYSIRSCPSSRRMRRLTAESTYSMRTSQKSAGAGTSPAPGPPLRRGGQRRRDVGEDRPNVRARRGDGGDADERDERDQQRVLEQVLPFVVVRQRAEIGNQTHDFLPARTHRAMCAIRSRLFA